MIFFFVALYPVWGYMTLAIQIIFFTGFLNVGHFLPGGWVLKLIIIFKNEPS